MLRIDDVTLSYFLSLELHNCLLLLPVWGTLNPGCCWGGGGGGENNPYSEKNSGFVLTIMKFFLRRTFVQILF